MVEYASTFLMSFCARPIVAANKAVAAPMTATINIAVGAWVKIAEQRTIMETPAVTIVAAWINAETGVGPAIASGSQTYNGIWALLPTAPMKRSTAIDVTPPAKMVPHVNGSTCRTAKTYNALSKMPPGPACEKKLTEPVSINVSKMPRTKPQSPTRCVMNTVLLASPRSFL